jgi:hypothetical protein
MTASSWAATREAREEFGASNGANPAPELLSSEAVAEFVARGMLRLDGVIPEEVNRHALVELRAGDVPCPEGLSADDAVPRARFSPGVRLSQYFVRSKGVGEMLRHPRVQGLIWSLVGPDPYYDHHAVHVRRRGEPSQPLHADAIVDSRAAFDIQLMYYPEGATPEGGGTLLVPGSHLRQINESDIARHQNLAGQIYLEAPPGTVLALHHGIWHAGRRTHLDRPRYMFKIRLNPRVTQVRLWDVRDLDDPAVLRRVRDILGSREPWFEGATARLEQVQRAALFRRLSGLPDFQVEYWLGRLENQSRPRLDELTPGGSPLSR